MGKGELPMFLETPPFLEEPHPEDFRTDPLPKTFLGPALRPKCQCTPSYFFASASFFIYLC